MFFPRDNSAFEARQVRTVVPLRQTHPARLALDPQTKRDAYRLRYDSYLTSGYIEPNQDRFFQDQYDDLPNCQTIVIYDEDLPVASVRTCTLSLASGQRTPASDAFPEEVNELLLSNRGTGPDAGSRRPAWSGVPRRKMIRVLSSCSIEWQDILG